MRKTKTKWKTGSKRNQNIVMKSRFKREQMPSCDWVQNLTKDVFLDTNVSDCCGAEVIRIMGSLRCTKCDKYCEFKK